MKYDTELRISEGQIIGCGKLQNNNRMQYYYCDGCPYFADNCPKQLLKRQMLNKGE